MICTTFALRNYFYTHADSIEKHGSWMSPDYQLDQVDSRRVALPVSLEMKSHKESL